MHERGIVLTLHRCDYPSAIVQPRTDYDEKRLETVLVWRLRPSQVPDPPAFDNNIRNCGGIAKRHETDAILLSRLQRVSGAFQGVFSMQTGHEQRASSLSMFCLTFELELRHI